MSARYKSIKEITYPTSLPEPKFNVETENIDIFEPYGGKETTKHKSRHFTLIYEWSNPKILLFTLRYFAPRVLFGRFYTKEESKGLYLSPRNFFFLFFTDTTLVSDSIIVLFIVLNDSPKISGLDFFTVKDSYNTLGLFGVDRAQVRV